MNYKELPMVFLCTPPTKKYLEKMTRQSFGLAFRQGAEFNHRHNLAAALTTFSSISISISIGISSSCTREERRFPRQLGAGGPVVRPTMESDIQWRGAWRGESGRRKVSSTSPTDTTAILQRYTRHMVPQIDRNVCAAVPAGYAVKTPQA